MLGLPIVVNSGVGDVEKMVDQIRCGVAIGEFSCEAYGSAIARLDKLPGTPRERRKRALPLFDVGLGIEKYDYVYRDLLDGTEKPIASNA